LEGHIDPEVFATRMRRFGQGLGRECVPYALESEVDVCEGKEAGEIDGGRGRVGRESERNTGGDEGVEMSVEGSTHGLSFAIYRKEGQERTG